MCSTIFDAFALDSNRIEIIAGIAYFTSKPVPQLSLAEGAAAVERGISIQQELAARDDVKALIADLRSLTSMPGPRTKTAMGEILRVWEAARKRGAVLINRNHPTRVMMMTRLIQTHAPEYGCLVYEMTQARAWAVAGVKPTSVDED